MKLPLRARLGKTARTRATVVGMRQNARSHRTEQVVDQPVDREEVGFFDRRPGGPSAIAMLTDGGARKAAEPVRRLFVVTISRRASARGSCGRRRRFQRWMRALLAQDFSRERRCSVDCRE